MMKDVRQVLELSRIEDKIKFYTKTELGKKNATDVSMIDDYLILERELKIVDEAMLVITKTGNLPIVTSIDLEPLISFALKGGILTPKDLNDIAEDINTSLKVINFINKLTIDSPLLKEYVRDFSNLSNLENSIKGVISPNLTIYDNASSTLSSIRKKIVSTESELQAKINGLVRTYSAILSDGNVTLRNDHFVLPVKTSDKHKINGIIHDVSNTGETTFIEPNSIVELNNKIYLLRLDEQEEIKRILMSLTREVIAFESDLRNNNAMIGYLDYVQAKALYGIEIDGYTAILHKEQQVHLKNAKHPLLDKNKVVANSFDLTSDERVMIITGPNAGGKTVALKTVGLLILMTQCAMPIPTSEKAHLSMFNHIYLDVGDNQSIEENLSTFSAHILNIASIMNNIGGKDIILIDELGTGTSPLEGEAIAVSVINEILAKHSFAIVSSHYEGVKLLAMEKSNILNASALYDEEKFMPTYKIKVGMPGKSYGIEVAMRFGLREDLIRNARAYLEGKQDKNLDEVINKLEKQILLNEKINTDLNKRENELKRREEESNKVLANIDKIREEAKQSAEEEKELLIAEAKKEIDNILNELKQNEVKLHTITAAKKQLDNLVNEEPEIEFANEEVEIGDYVKIRDTNMIGKIIRMNKNNLVVVTQEGLNVNTKKNKVIKTLAPKNKVAPRNTKTDQFIMSKSVPLELNIIGLHVDEAMDQVIKYLDTCVARKVKCVRIIHGSGTGALRTAVHNYLKNQKFVDSFRFGGAGEGGVGATVVNLK